MRIDAPTLIKVAEDLVNRRLKETSTILAVYLHGSVNEPVDHLLGDSGDLDLVIIHEYEAAASREIIRLTDDLTIDIANHTRVHYRLPRELRTDPWLGAAVYGFRILYDPRHFLDFVQAGLRDQFHRPSNVLARAQAFSRESRRRWAGLLTAVDEGPETALEYLAAVSEAANAAAVLAGGPLPERRLLTRFFDRSENLGEAELYLDLVALLGADELDADDLQAWIASWGEAFEAAARIETVPVGWGLHPDRLRYYRGAFREQTASARPTDALWPLLLTWTRAAATLPPAHDARAAWDAAANQIGLTGPGREPRLEGLDAYLDRVEGLLDNWGRAQGVDM
ncbi:MAG TPA: hypothetical protein VMN57_09880 [Anaerolineales bacterium]|nr:hypothetical protein [Anaerolineales bacterium]